jgi:type IV pilus assembly protein PilV
MRARRSQAGAALIEVLVAMLIVAFGALGFVGLQARTTVSTLEGYQRAQALVLLNDMAQRMNANRAAAASYVASDIGVADPGNCPPGPVATRDLCQWSDLIRGAAVQHGGTNVGAVQAARGCIESVGTNRYLLSVVWQGVQPTGATPLACGSGDYAAENLRRGVSVVLQMADLSAP